jgi:hypothetical protein
MGNMKGISITHMQAFLEQRFGLCAWTELLNTIPKHDKLVLSTVVAEAWYDNSVHATINRAFCDLFFLVAT